MAKSKFYVTTPIYYVNDKPHIGHSYTTIAADVLARYHKLAGDDTFFLTGTDEHGAKIQEIAKSKGKDPKKFVDEISSKFKLAWKALDISYDNFIRTTDAHHEKAVTEVLNRLYKDGYIYKGKYEALYCVGCEQYKTKSDLVNGKCSDHQKEPEVHEEEAYLLKLSDFQKDLLKKIKSDEYKIRPQARKNEVLSFIEEGLEDIAISRKKEKVSWGIEIPFNKSHTTYVWIDAFLNYLTGLGWPKNKKNYKKFWPADVHLMSKDILRVHATIWPAILLALGEELPKQLFIHGYFTINGQKMSKSLGNIIDPIELSEKYGTDTIRYFILREFPFGSDGNFSIKRLEERYNSDLANDLGNLVRRVSVMIDKYLDGKVPKEINIKGISKKEAKKEFKEINKQINDIDKLMGEFKFDQVLEIIWSWIRSANQYIDKEEPWVLAKKDKDKLEKVLFNLTSVILDISWYLGPFMPETAEKITNIFKEEKVKIEKPLFPRLN